MAPASSNPATRSGTAAKLVNRTAPSKSPFVSAKSHDTVAWQVLDDDAVELARHENKLIYLHIGYKACHFSHLMATESFSHPDCAAILNSSFIPVVVDREERPDIDTIYMNYVQAVNAAGGWPLNVFLTPELEPVFGGTYWPAPGVGDGAANKATGASGGVVAGAAAVVAGPDREALGLTDDAGEDEPVLDFLIVLNRMRQIWLEQEQRCRVEAKEVLTQLREFAAEGTLGTRDLAAAPYGVAFETALAPRPQHTNNPHLTDDPSHHVRSSSELDLDQLEEAYTHMAKTFDPLNGGFGLAPKFPTPPKLLFLLKLSQFPRAVGDVVGELECARAQHMALYTLRKIRDGALRDHVGGTGIARCAVTPDWSLPNFEKLIADNALLLKLYIDAWKVAGGAAADGEFLDIINELVDYLTRSAVLLQDSGLWASSEAADSCYRKGDSAMGEGAYYVWTRREFDAAIATPVSGETPGEASSLPSSTVATIAAAHWNVLEDGNIAPPNDPSDEFVNRNIMRIVRPVPWLSAQLNLPESTVRSALTLAKSRLRARRERDRVRPETDTKVVTAHNGLVISALARAAKELENVDGARAELCKTAANRAVRSLKERLWDPTEKVLYRVWCYDSRGGTKAFADDYAFVVQGLLDLFALSSDEDLLEWADELQEIQIKLFYDPLTQPGNSNNHNQHGQHHHLSGAFYSTSLHSAHAILRLKDGIDTSMPSTNAVSAENLFRLAHLLGPSANAYAARARETVAAFEAEMLQHPWLFPGLLAGVVWARLGFSGDGENGRFESVRTRRVATA